MYKQQPFDVIIDCVGVNPALYTECASYLRQEGKFINLGGMSVTALLQQGSSPSLDSSNSSPVAVSTILSTFLSWAWWNVVALRLPRALGGQNVGRSYQFYSAQPNIHDIRRMVQMVEAEDGVKGILDSVWEMEDVLKGYERVMSGRARGKVVVRISEELRSNGV